MKPPDTVEDLLRSNAPQVLGALPRRYGHFDLAEEAVQEALLAAAEQWPRQGPPDNPRGWLIRVASRRLTDLLRSEEAHRRREETAAALTPGDAFIAPAPGESRAPAEDDTLTLLFLCCHPELSPAAQVTLTLWAVGGLTTAEIARAHLVPEVTMAQRISRAKRKVKGVRFRQPTGADRDERLAVVLQVLQVLFNEGYTATSGATLHRAEPARPAIRLVWAMRRLPPRDGAVTGSSRPDAAHRGTHSGAYGGTYGPGRRAGPARRADRDRWDRAAIDEGTKLVKEALGQPPDGVYQLQAAIAALHDEAERAEDTDWPQILSLYELLVQRAHEPMAQLGRVVAVAMVHGPEAGLRTR